MEWVTDRNWETDCNMALVWENSTGLGIGRWSGKQPWSRNTALIGEYSTGLGIQHWSGNTALIWEYNTGLGIHHQIWDTELHDSF